MSNIDFPRAESWQVICNLVYGDNIQEVSMSSPVMSSWSVALRGIAALVFGLLALARPGSVLIGLVLVFGAYALVDGVLTLVSAAKEHAEYGRGWLVLEGVADIFIGLVALVWPGITALALTYLIAAWAIIKGIFEIVGAVRLRKYIRREWLYIVGGLVSILLGVAIFARPISGALALTWMLGIYGVFFGVVLLGLSFNLRRVEKAVIPEEEERRRAA
jgi:uncharacterized membrane protein HdeD (DUF308 family)